MDNVVGTFLFLRILKRIIINDSHIPILLSISAYEGYLEDGWFCGGFSLSFESTWDFFLNEILLPLESLYL
jgi:hypothetical protein